ncbi:glycine cleavage system protein T [Egibacter rhizosphaerae]|uniref:Glycine cleavage system protein T n=1 Tax=Egibacter rhizosphaerae TaxID=1670831 RepID=A0A411YDG4_9ACTN|nr:glycine cleavage T C-terminal barrel domain-containing protein [Egibacter rhizosphaerae]QBI19251.1 glycine cleavage system protein T [Egibacter rhizosphaerae]
MTDILDPTSGTPTAGGDAATDQGASPPATDAPGAEPDTAPGVLLYPRLRKSPYFWASREHGVKLYSVYNHSYHPRLYTDPLEEYWALRNDVTLWDVGGAERQIEISGPQAFDFTNLVIPRDLSKCKVGQCKYVFITAPDGGIVNDPVLLRVEENRFWFSLADSDVLLYLLGLNYALGMDVEIKEVDVSPVQVQGPKSKQVLVDLFGDSILDLPYYYLRRYQLDDMTVEISRTGYSGEIGYEIYLYDASQHGVKLWSRIWEAGQPHGMRPIGPCHMRRIEGGMLAYGCDITLDTNPLEVGYDYKWMVDLEQEADFIGKDALIAARERGVSRLIAGLEISGPSLGGYIDGSMIEPFPVYRAGESVGRVTSACRSPELDKNIGLALLAVEFTAIGTELTVETPEGARHATVVPKPFVDPTKETPKQ